MRKTLKTTSPHDESWTELLNAGEQSHSPASAERTQSSAKAEDESSAGAIRPQSCGLIVGVGASAGGLEALTELFRETPHDHAAYVVLQHLSPRSTSLLPTLLQRVSSINVVEALDGAVLSVNTIYVIVPNTDVAISNGTLSVWRRRKEEDHRSPIDFFFRSLAQDQGSRAVGVVLSGTGTDGTKGLQAIRDRGGITFAQDSGSARFPGMPTSASESGCVQFILPPAEIAREIVRCSSRHEVSLNVQRTQSENWLGTLIDCIKRVNGFDFHPYKPSTLIRRIERRAALKKCSSVEQYLKDVVDDRSEIQRLAEDMLINVTKFFRDTEVFQYLEQTTIPDLISRKSTNNHPIRIWVSACSTGEEAYSIAILFASQLEKLKSARRVQVFATDVSLQSIETARRGVYPVSIADDIEATLLDKYFDYQHGGYRVKQVLRALVVFSTHDILLDPPFSRMDLITCRNILIYLNTAAQKQTFNRIHYALAPQGYLALGTSESAAEASDLFASQNIRHKIYRKNQGSDSFNCISHTTKAKQLHLPVSEIVKKSAPGFDSSSLDAQIIALSDIVGFVVDENDMVVKIQGNLTHSRKLRPGQVQLDLRSVSPPAIEKDIRRAVLECRTRLSSGKATKSAEQKGVARDSSHVFAAPYQEATARHWVLVVFWQHKVTTTTRGDDAVTSKTRPLRRTKADLIVENNTWMSCVRDLQQELGAAVDQQWLLEKALSAAKEDSQARMEELQSTVEELETSKEEMQSANEEVMVVNEELRVRMNESETYRNDMQNMLACLDQAIIILDHKGHLRRYSRRAQELFGLEVRDIAKPIDHIHAGFSSVDLSSVVKQVHATREPYKQALWWQQKAQYDVTIKASKASDGSLETYVLIVETSTPSSIDTHHLQTEKARFAHLNWGTVRQSVIAFNEDLEVFWANEASFRMFTCNRSDLLDKHLSQVDLPDDVRARAMSIVADMIKVRGGPMDGPDSELATDKFAGRVTMRFLASGKRFFTLHVKEVKDATTDNQSAI